MSIRALVVSKEDDGPVSSEVTTITEDQLPEADVTVAVEYSTLNYKDGLCITGTGGLVRNFPHVPGIDFAGTVEKSDSDAFLPGDRVVLTGWRVGEAWWGGYSQKARVKSDWLVRLPEEISTKQAMAVGTAGFTSMLSVIALENMGLTADNGPVLVTGAAGGVGSVATAILANLGYEVAAVTGRPETADYLTGLGAATIVPREDLAEAPTRPLDKEMWAG
ncbi:MAG: acryloyl-CoA reductase, partial [Pseudomonadota bacterium]